MTYRRSVPFRFGLFRIVLFRFVLFRLVGNFGLAKTRMATRLCNENSIRFIIPFINDSSRVSQLVIVFCSNFLPSE